MAIITSKDILGAIGITNFDELNAKFNLPANYPWISTELKEFLGSADYSYKWEQTNTGYDFYLITNNGDEIKTTVTKTGK